MATLPNIFRKGEGAESQTPARKPAAVRPERDPYHLRALPLESLVFYCKKIDNSRLVREPDPKSRGACWSAIATACAVVALLAGALAPSMANTIAGYKLENLRREERRLRDERRTLELRLAEIAAPQHLERLARERDLAPPAPGQVTHLDAKGEGAMAMAKK
ncbi:MAG: hypothetical protein LAQ30_14615 [Acidobacteriia bacterium]|nr:hypothetical protein [Terriglobia bacterium]